MNAPRPITEQSGEFEPIPIGMAEPLEPEAPATPHRMPEMAVDRPAPRAVVEAVSPLEMIRDVAPMVVGEALESQDAFAAAAIAAPAVPVDPQSATGPEGTSIAERIKNAAILSQPVVQVAFDEENGWSARSVKS